MNNNSSKKLKHPNSLSKVISVNRPMTSRSPLDVLINTAKRNTLPPDRQSLYNMMVDQDATSMTFNELDANKSLHLSGKQCVGYSHPDIRLLKDNLPGVHVTTQAYESNVSSVLKSSNQMANLFYSHRNYETLNRQKYHNLSSNPNTSVQGKRVAMINHLTLQHQNKYNQMHSSGYIVNSLKQGNYNYPTVNAKKSPQREFLHKMSKIDKVERIKQIDSKLDYLHNLYTRQRNLYISTYKANNDLISEAFSTIKLLKDELIYIKNNCVCNYSKQNTTEQKDGSINKENKENESIGDNTVGEEVKEKEDNDKIDGNIEKENVVEEEIHEKDRNGIITAKKERNVKNKQVKLKEEDKIDIEDQQEAEMIVGRYRKNKK